MGWDSEDRWSRMSRKEFAEVLASQDNFAKGYTPLAKRVVGNHVWQLVRGPDGVAFIALDIMRREEGRWWRKGITEHMGPSAVDCPLSLLDRADSLPVEGIGYAGEWRAKVRAYHAVRAAAPKPESGMVVAVGPCRYRLESPFVAPGRGWLVSREGDGKQFRMSAKDVARLLREQVVEAKASEAAVDPLEGLAEPAAEAEDLADSPRP